jgi:DNA primase
MQNLTQQRILAIKERCDLRYIAEHLGVDIKKRQGDTWSGLCPFHQDTTPSCSFRKENFRCFACNASGDLIHFVQSYKQVPFWDALKWLGEYCGVSMHNPRTLGLEKPAFELYETYDVRAKRVEEAVNPMVFIDTFLSKQIPPHMRQRVVLQSYYSDAHKGVLHFIRDWYQLPDDQESRYDALIIAEKFLDEV